jgi:hypothetical protein
VDDLVIFEDDDENPMQAGWRLENEAWPERSSFAEIPPHSGPTVESWTDL